MNILFLKVEKNKNNIYFNIKKKVNRYKDWNGKQLNIFYFQYGEIKVIYDSFQVVYINNGIVGFRGYQIVQFWLVVMFMMLINGIYKFVVLLNGVDQF